MEPWLGWTTSRAAQARLEQTRVIVARQQSCGRTVARSLRILLPGAVPGPADAVGRPVHPAAPTGPAKTRETACEGSAWQPGRAPYRLPGCQAPGLRLTGLRLPRALTGRGLAGLGHNVLVGRPESAGKEVHGDHPGAGPKAGDDPPLPRVEAGPTLTGGCG